MPPPIKRKYTGTTDCPQPRDPARRGTIVWDQHCRAEFPNLTQVGIYSHRKARGKPNQWSVHSSWRAIDYKYTDRSAALEAMDWLVANAVELGIEFIADYATGQFGRGWRCDRWAWKVYRKREIEPIGMWLIHIEISPKWADDPAKVRAGWDAAKLP